MRQRLFAIGALMVVSLACDGPQLVAFNERLFLTDTTASEGGGCEVYELRGRTRASSLLGGVDEELFVSHRQTDEEVIVEVLRGPVVVSSKTYGESFFGASTVDEYVASAASGSSVRLRHWGALGGVDACTPLEQDRP